MIRKKLNDITKDDLELLVENNVQERKTLEYKAILPDNSDGGRKEFLADISSLANTEGGDLVFGLCEVDGTLQEEIGLEISNADAEVSRLENMARDSISPRITLDVCAVEVDSKQVIIVRTKASLEAPHRVIYKGSDKFYKRNSNGKYAMDVAELRSTFLQSGKLTECIRRFRTARITDIKAGDAPLTISNPSVFFAIHIVPLTAFSTSFRITPKILLELKEGKHSSLFQPLRASGWSHRINLDGAVVYSTDTNNDMMTYTQFYGDGKIEALDNFTLSASAERGSNILPMGGIEGLTMSYVAKMLQLLATFEFQPPFYVFVSLVGIEGFTVSKPEGFISSDTELITQKELLLPEVVIENISDDLSQKFKPIFDMIWNSAGVSRSLNYDEDGNFKDDLR